MAPRSSGTVAVVDDSSGEAALSSSASDCPASVPECVDSPAAGWRPRI